MKFEAAKRAVSPVAVGAALAFTLATAGTVAYLAATASDANVFALGSVSVELTEDKGSPADDPATEAIESEFAIDRADDGSWADIAKDPVVTVKGGSAECYVFAVLEESESFDRYLAYDVAEGWERLVDEDGEYVAADGGGEVWWRVAGASAEDQAIHVLAGDVVSVLDGVTDEQVRALGTEGNPSPTLSISATAVQAAGFGSAFEAWALAGM